VLFPSTHQIALHAARLKHERDPFCFCWVFLNWQQSLFK